MKFTEELSRLSDAATRLPWRVFGDGSVRKPGGLFAEGDDKTDGVFICRPDDWDDAALICLLANRRREILALVEAARDSYENGTNEARIKLGDALANLDRTQEGE